MDRSDIAGLNAPSPIVIQQKHHEMNIPELLDFFQ